MKINIDAFTEQSLPDPAFPENSWEANSFEEALEMVKNCARPIAGIRMVQIWIPEG